MYEFSQFMAMAGYLPEGSVCTSNTLTILAATDDGSKVQGKCAYKSVYSHKKRAAKRTEQELR